MQQQQQQQQASLSQVSFDILNYQLPRLDVMSIVVPYDLNPVPDPTALLPYSALCINDWDCIKR